MVQKSTNITLKIGSDLARDAKVLAARRGTSLSRLVADQLAILVRGEQTYAAAKRRAVRRLRQGYDLEWQSGTNREDLHDRE